MSSTTEVQLRDNLTEQLENIAFLNSDGLPQGASSFYVGKNADGSFFWNFGYGYQLTDVSTSLAAIQNAILSYASLDADKLQSDFTQISSLINIGTTQSLVNQVNALLPVIFYKS